MREDDWGLVNGALAELSKYKLMVMQVDAPLIKGTNKHLFTDFQINLLLCYLHQV